MKNFQKGGGMDDVLKFVTLDGGLRKKNGEWFLCFLQKWLNFKTFLATFWFEWPVLRSAQRAQNKHKKHWRAHAELFGVLSNDILRKAKKWSYKI